MEVWRDYIARSEAGCVADALDLARVEIDEKRSLVRAYFTSKELVSREQSVQMIAALSGAFPQDAKLELNFSYPQLAQNLFEETVAFSGYLREAIVSLHAGFTPYAPFVDFEIERNVLKVLLPNEGALSLWKSSRLAEGFEHFVMDSFCCPLEVRTTVAHREDFALPVITESPVSAVNLPQINASAAKPKKLKIEPTPGGTAIFGKALYRAEKLPISAVNEEANKVELEGKVFKVERKDTRDGLKTILLFSITDYSDSITCKALLDLKSSECARALEGIKEGAHLRVYGHAHSDKYSGYELIIDAKCAALIDSPARTDSAEQKRVELHLHTQLSTMDSTLSIADAVQTAARWGHSALAVTDHGVVQAFPEFYSAAKKAGIKAIFGMEGYLLDDCDLVSGIDEFVVFDVETTGLKEKTCHIIEIGAVRLRAGEIVERFNTFINPGIAIPSEITALTGINDEMIADAPQPSEAIGAFKAFSAGVPLIAHNASFDMRFIEEHGSRYGILFEQGSIDTLAMARYLLRDLEHHRLNDLTEYFEIELNSHHRADCDAEATAKIFLKLVNMMNEQGVDQLPLVTYEHRHRHGKAKNPSYHIVFLVENAVGLKNLYKLVTHSHLQHFSRRPRIPRSLLNMHRLGLIVGSACEAGELYSAAVAGAQDDALHKIAENYDYLEIQPRGNNGYLVRTGKLDSEKAILDINAKICAIADGMGKPCIATGDVHFLEPRDECYRRVLLAAQKFDDADHQPPLYFKTTDEMLAEFSYLGEHKAREVVIDNPSAIAQRCEMMKPFPFETCQPIIEGAEEELVKSCYERAHAIYSENLPAPVKDRLEHELGSITKYKFSVLYIIARKLVLKSNSDGYLVGSRGSVGSSFAAFLSGITEVNALQPHYVCPNCKHSDFDVDLKKYSCGCDMDDKNCPVCGTQYEKDGYNIPFETFLGFEGDKVPDIDLNFSGDYQPVAHKYTEELFGKGYVFRAGTISGVQDKTAYGYVKKYLDERGKVARRAEMDRLALGCCGVKRTTGQHPGGIVVVPKDRSVFEFTPLQHPADKDDAASVTTHFDFNSMHDTLVKLDILGHDDPTMLRMLEDLTGLDPKEIPLDDPETMDIFSSLGTLEVDQSKLGSEVGTFGIPEFGTNFVRRMLVETRPTTMEELVRISGLSHGTDVWTNNAQELVKKGIATLSEVICTRDDIMTYLIMCGVEKKAAFNIMESVRKGKGLKPEMESAMSASGVPVWYIDSCKKIKYMFPRAHAAAYVMMAFRIAYYKVHRPLAYYAAYFTVRADAFEIDKVQGSYRDVSERINEIERKGKDASQQEKSLQTVLELVLEMYLRGFSFEKIDIMESDAEKFKIASDKTLLPPLNTISGLGTKASQGIALARKDGPFMTREDLRDRAKIGPAAIELLIAGGCLGDMPESNQVTLFDLAFG